MSKEQTSEGLHWTGAAAARVWSLQEALREVPGVQPRELHDMDQVRRVGDDFGGHGPSTGHLWARHRTTEAWHARGVRNNDLFYNIRIASVIKAVNRETTIMVLFAPDLSGIVEVLHWLWDWAGRVWKHQESLQKAVAANSTRQGENR